LSERHADFAVKNVVHQRTSFAKKIKNSKQWQKVYKTVGLEHVLGLNSNVLTNQLLNTKT
jgi:hypothetical protein